MTRRRRRVRPNSRAPTTNVAAPMMAHVIGSSPVTGSVAPDGDAVAVVGGAELGADVEGAGDDGAGDELLGHGDGRWNVAGSNWGAVGIAVTVWVMQGRGPGMGLASAG